MMDFLQIGVSSGMDAAKMAVADSVCGQARNISKFITFPLKRFLKNSHRLFDLQKM
jgi:hypothetical protein